METCRVQSTLSQYRIQILNAFEIKKDYIASYIQQTEKSRGHITELPG